MGKKKKTPQYPVLGAHMSIAGGYYKAVGLAADACCQCVQLFTKNNNQWRAKEIVADDVARFRKALGEKKIVHPLSHSSYLINLASPDKALWKKSVDAMVVELQRADALGIPYVVVHPGAFTTSTETKGIRAIVRALNEIHKQTRSIDSNCLLETTAGQGTCLGCTFEQLARMLDGARDPDRLGVCFDTCHVFSAGYALQTEKEYRATMREFNNLIGVKRIKAFHLNDSKTPFDSHVDRHEQIGKGSLGTRPFRNLLSDRRFRKVPMYLETPKGEKNGKNLDIINLRTLRRLVPK